MKDRITIIANHIKEAISSKDIIVELPSGKDLLTHLKNVENSMKKDLIKMLSKPDLTDEKKKAYVKNAEDQYRSTIQSLSKKFGIYVKTPEGNIWG